MSSPVILLETRRFTDQRGWFAETYSAPRMLARGIDDRFVQDNHSYSAEAGTIRGLHYQSPPRAQAKLLRVMRGAVIDVAVDVRKGSPTYGRHVRMLLSADNGAQLFVPAGFLHGFATLEPHTDVAYKVTDYYSQPDDGSVLWNDPDLAIDWGVDPARAVLSDKDAKAPRFAEFKSPF